MNLFGSLGNVRKDEGEGEKLGMERSTDWCALETLFVTDLFSYCEDKDCNV